MQPRCAPFGLRPLPPIHAISARPRPMKRPRCLHSSLTRSSMDMCSDSEDDGLVGAAGLAFERRAKLSPTRD